MLLYSNFYNYKILFNLGKIVNLIKCLQKTYIYYIILKCNNDIKRIKYD